MKMKAQTIAGAIVFLATLTACSGGKQSPLGFSLPEGDANAGKEAFVMLQCNACHSTPDIEQLKGVPPGDISVYLGGDVPRIKTYANLVTSVINPSHRISKANPPEMVSVGDVSRMPNYNGLMTVEQMVDVVAYLQPHYKLRVYQRMSYTSYYP
jgi:sulfur-oxidizing protein SoxX